uniref:LSM7 homolog, U6 small nuclear RNA and mRNA degradation associated n=1 Tax=Cyprinus carpio TaxID=7962 RepID=A0A8C1YE13_CYPCA
MYCVVYYYAKLHCRIYILDRPVIYCIIYFQDKDKKKKESIFDLSKYIDKHIRVKFQGGREASGVLKGFDPLLNLVLDGTTEYILFLYKNRFCRNVALHHLLTSGSSAVNGCRQNESPNS